MNPRRIGADDRMASRVQDCPLQGQSGMQFPFRLLSLRDIGDTAPDQQPAFVRQPAQAHFAGKTPASPIAVPPFENRRASGPDFFDVASDGLGRRPSVGLKLRAQADRTDLGELTGRQPEQRLSPRVVVENLPASTSSTTIASGAPSMRLR